MAISPLAGKPADVSSLIDAPRLLTAYTENGWFAVRPSGTEDVYKIYAESFRDREHLRRIQEEARQMVDPALRPLTKRQVR